ncbi:MAG: histidinol dehydrogenase [Defluviitaleaceae bacterium]|nr:histidinol dehydrogenase [Defluviitaleaceae bacterium]
MTPFKLNNNLSKITTRQAETNATVTASVREILNDIRTNGDTALKQYIQKFDGYTGASLLASPEEIAAGVHAAGSDFIRILQRAAQQIRAYHANQVEKSWSMHQANGVVLGQLVRPLARVALYVPGGTAAYPSTVLMNAIPAQLAGVKDIAIFTPVKADGKVPDVILAAAACCGIDTVYKIGGAQAVAAAAYGTETIAKVDKIVGPGNIYVATAKQLVYGVVDIDMIAGPSEILIIADETANPKYVAADMLSQAEHDEMASAILVTTSQKVIDETEKELTRQLGYLQRKDIAEKSLTNYGAAVLVDSLEAAFAISNNIAPEHLEILTDNPLEKLPYITNAGSIFLGENTPEPLGDYMSGTNHVLPTGGTAKFSSPLGVYDFVKYSAYSYYPRKALAAFADDVAQFAELEGLDAHANAVKVRFEDGTV